ncbi:Tetratricopeptide repeat protein [Posidoniimonas corsicana]|uniref:Tetratricopeptide repeat protein n=1 Tax=Posidoniimonas corsicana TaxID=1938618 RepID=A0A5C5VGL8_9BACT|nr:hypothetical protein [Posidoniimonas corsicana]TWT37090.1 Tetratricopeptide repeat protein [Posidoniimonas corsicana]
MDRPPIHLRVLDGLREAGARVVDVREWVAEKWDHAFGTFFDSLLGVFDSFESLESGVARLVQIVFWPITATARLLRIDRLLGFLIHLPALIAWGVFAGLMRAAELVHMDGVLQRVADFMYWLTTPVRAVFSFVHAWGATRSARDLALATPALLMLLPFAYVAIAGKVQGHGTIAERYREAVRDADEQGDYEVADLMRRKLEQLGVSTNRSDYIAAARLEEQGDMAGAYQKMKGLAPADAPGFMPAQYWIVQKLLANELTKAEEPELADPNRRLELALERLNQVSAATGQSEALALTRAYILVEQGHPDQALEAIGSYGSASFPAAAMRLRILAKSGRQRDATEQARLVLRLFDEHQPAEPSADDHRSRALAAAVAGEDQHAEQALLDLVAIEPDDPQARQQLSVVSMRLAQRTLGSDSFNGRRLAERVVRAQRLGAPPEAVASALQSIVAQRRRSDAHREAWNELLAAPDAGAELIHAAGTIAASAGEITQARKAFRQLTDAGDAPPVVWNNLAWALSQEPRPEYAEALVAVNHALAAEPNNPRFRETRGQAYLHLKRWREALDDLEHSLNAMPDSPGVHAGLATAYEAVGETQLADIHRLHGAK